MLTSLSTAGTIATSHAPDPVVISSGVGTEGFHKQIIRPAHEKTARRAPPGNVHGARRPASPSVPHSMNDVRVWNPFSSRKIARSRETKRLVDGSSPEASGT